MFMLTNLRGHAATVVLVSGTSVVALGLLLLGSWRHPSAILLGQPRALACLGPVVWGTVAFVLTKDASATVGFAAGGLLVLALVRLSRSCKAG